MRVSFPGGQSRIDTGLGRGGRIGCGPAGAAQTAANEVINEFPTAVIIAEAALDCSIQFDDKENVTVKTSMKVKVPVPFPGMDEINFSAQAVEPVVGPKADVKVNM